MNNDIELSIVIPVLNGEPFLLASLSKLASWIKFQSLKTEVIFVNDGSSDKTNEILNNFHEFPNFQVIDFKRNSGKGAAIKAGLNKASGSYVVFTDADLPYGLDIFTAMLAKIKANHIISLIYGSRSHKQSVYKEGYGLGRRLGRFFFSSLIKTLVPIGVSDTQSGIKMLRLNFAKLAVKKLSIDRFAFDVELFVLAKQNNLLYVDFPVVLNQRKESSVHFIKDTFNMIKDILKIRYKMIIGYYRQA